MTSGTELGRALIGLLLIGSGAAKLADLGAVTSMLISLSRRVSREGNRAALVASGVEIASGLLVLTGEMRLAVDSFVLVLTSVVLGLAVRGMRLARGKPCRCFGYLTESRFGWITTLRAGGLLLGASAIWMLDPDFGATLPLGWHVVAILGLSSVFGVACLLASRSIAGVNRLRLSA